MNLTYFFPIKNFLYQTNTQLQSVLSSTLLVRVFRLCLCRTLFWSVSPLVACPWFCFVFHGAWAISSPTTVVHIFYSCPRRTLRQLERLLKKTLGDMHKIKLKYTPSIPNYKMLQFFFESAGLFTQSEELHVPGRHSVAAQPAALWVRAGGGPMVVVRTRQKK